jgi:8-oxo-dGTP pyrophosphatase MutT (NUDIX family)
MTPPEMRAWITSKLDPLESWDPAKRVSEPDFEDYQGPLTPAAVLVPLVEHEEGVTVLLTRRADTLRNHTGQVAFPGGRCEPGELPWEAALREADEEIGLDAGHVTLAGLSTGYQTRTGFDITPVVAFVRPGFTVTPSPDEVAEVFETPFAFLMDTKNHQRRFLEQADGLRRYFYSMSHDDQVIWGVTAGMLRGLYQRLYGPLPPDPDATPFKMPGQAPLPGLSTARHDNP